MKYLIIIVFLTSCYSSKNFYVNKAKDSIIGKWCLTNNQINYPSIIFNEDSTCILNSLSDTVYRFKYYLKNKDLYITMNKNNVVINRILKFTNDSLIFENLLEKSNSQTYYRCDLERTTKFSKN